MSGRQRSLNERVAIGLRTGRLRPAADEADAFLRERASEIADLERLLVATDESNEATS